MSLKLEYKTLDVFTSTSFLGNPLAIVHVPANAEAILTQEQKQKIAREFNFLETIFLHEVDSSGKVKVDIFTTTEEIPFGGHPTIGTSWYLLSKTHPHLQSVILDVKAGTIPATRVDGTHDVRLQVPTNFKIHTPYNHPRLKGPWISSLANKLSSSDFVNGEDGAEPLVSIVKGMNFFLVEVTSEEALSRLVLVPEFLILPDGHLPKDWDLGVVGVYVFFPYSSSIENGIRRLKIKTRTFFPGMEDPACGSGTSALSGYLSLKKAARGDGTTQFEFEITQGETMGRKSEIRTYVSVKGGAEPAIESIDLAGTAVEVFEGSLRV